MGIFKSNMELLTFEKLNTFAATNITKPNIIMKKLIYLMVGLLLCVSCSTNDEEKPLKPLTPEVPTPTPDPTDDSGDDGERSAEAAKLLQFMKDIYGKKTISGTCANVNWNINEAQWVYKHTGKWPAMNTFDYIHHIMSQKGGWVDYENTQVVEDWHAAGGIVGLMWHWNVPANNGSDYSFYYGTDGDQTQFDVKKIFDETSSEYKLMIKDIDQIASYLKILKDKNIPVIWRPLHEAGGRWFWWGMDAEACKQLWKVMYKRFKDAGLNNLIWVFTPAAGWAEPYSKGFDWYPGDEYVDIVGMDVYNQSNANDCFTMDFKFLNDTKPQKMAALTECGNVATISSQWAAGAKWLFFMPWYDYGRTGDPTSTAFNDQSHSSASISWWQDAFGCDFVLTRDDIKH